METITITDLRPAEGATHSKKRVGRGRASGHGKTSTRGHNGEGQRSGRSKKRGFEGGQMPAYRRAPKLKGFEIVNRVVNYELNVSKLDKISEKEIDLDLLKELGLAPNNAQALRVLGNGEVKSAKTIKARHFSTSAKEKIEAAGGKAELV
ncbi:MAG: 50S ribosomal protein L15 [Candidatus Gastranaerophilales bacterium]|nr:50S ribosomal protein L15 [Candidatus Gastranaerophilales bacterium]